MSRTFPRVRVLLVIVLAALLTAGCRESAREVETVADVSIQMTVNPQPAAVGEAELVLTVTDSDGQPVTVRQIDVRGDMNHAGMVPVLRTIEEAGTGEFRVPFEWTMGGEWIVTVTATLDDDRVVEQDFELNVSSTRSNGDAGADHSGMMSMDGMVLADIEDCDDDLDEEEDDGGCGVLPPPDDNGLFQPIRP